MSREVQEPTEDERGDEVHPAFGMIGASRVSATPGAVLFDSELRHNHYVSVTITHASRKRDLNRDWIHGGSKMVTEIAMSEAQWASFVSSMNTSGVPCTLTRTQRDGMIPGLPYEPRLALSTQEATDAGARVYDRVKEALAAVEEKPTKANVRALRLAVDSAAPNVEYAAKSMTEHVENVVTKARADIEAMVTEHATRLGLTGAEVPVYEIGGSGADVIDPD